MPLLWTSHSQKLIVFFLAGYALSFSWSVPIANAFVDATIILSLICLRSHEKDVFTSNWPVLLLPFGFVCIAVISGLVSEHPANLIRPAWFLLYHPVTLVLTLAFIQNNSHRKLLLSAIVISIFSSSLFTIWQSFADIDRPAGPTGILLLSGTYLQLSLPFVLVLCLESSYFKNDVRAGLGFALFITLTAAVLSKTRASWVAIAFMLSMYAILRAKYYRTRHLVILGVILSIVFSFFIASPALSNRFLSIIDMAFVSNSERLFIWQSAWNIFLDHPLLGVGPGNFGSYYLSKYILASAREIQTHAHNNMMHYLAEMGLLGGLYFLGMFLYVFLHYLKRYRINVDDSIALAMLLSVSGFFVIGLMDWSYGMFPSSVQFFWFLVGLTWNWDEPGEKRC